jgi:protein AATF/BFR2
VLRKLHESIVDPYESVPTTRHHLNEDSAQNEQEDESEQVSPTEDLSVPMRKNESEQEQPVSPTEDLSVPMRKNESEREQPVAPTEDLSVTMRKTREEDRRKGKAISCQIVYNPSFCIAVTNSTFRQSGMPS